MRNAVNPSGLFNSLPHFSQAVIAAKANLVFVAGQASVDAAGEVVGEGDFEVQVRQTFANLRLALEGAGVGPGDVVKLNIYIAGLSAETHEVMRSVRSEFLGGVQPPAVTTVGVAALAIPNLLIEVDAIATTH